MSVLCLNVCRLCVPNIMSLGVCFKKMHFIKFGALFAWYSVKIRVIFGVRFERRKVDKKQTYMRNKTRTLCRGVFGTSVPNFSKIDPCNFEVYRFKVGAFLRHIVSVQWYNCLITTTGALKPSASPGISIAGALLRLEGPKFEAEVRDRDGVLGRYQWVPSAAVMESGRAPVISSSRV